ncbi:hypothetical protein HYO65_gp284 [Tenacibaculum phage PTm1]|uniref:Uncharacterized protein n=2 Tax=Shirahamavirus PTm1 TaxID=2846435 RepID=A0A5S9HXE8_9CAUD|nr:hypothetical protein HYO65_gp284 [Tenacibaculum phage PTm1]BBI90676.1 hypothetical protein [Tenacibaculum phage PTm1]BBI90983.1 hypothetical protein [Tenacibaculum phage PTm5]
MDIYDEIGQVDIEDLSDEMQEKIGYMGMLVSALYICGSISFVILMLKIIIKIYSN